MLVFIFWQRFCLTNLHFLRLLWNVLCKYDVHYFRLFLFHIVFDGGHHVQCSTVAFVSPHAFGITLVVLELLLIHLDIDETDLLYNGQRVSIML